MKKIINWRIENKLKELISLIEKIEEFDKDYARVITDSLIDKLSDFLKNEYELTDYIYDKVGGDNV